MKTITPSQLETARILVRAPNWIGDAVMCLPALRELRRALPRAELVLMARPWVLDVFPVEALRCRTIAYDTRREQRSIIGRWRFAAALRREKFGAAILLQNSFDAAMVTALADIPIRGGYARQGRRPLLTHAVKVPRRGETPEHETYYYLELLRQLGLIARLPEVNEIQISTTPPDRTHARQQLQESLSAQAHSVGGSNTTLNVTPNILSKLVVGFGAGASFGTAKRWLPERFAAIAARLGSELGATSIFFGSPDERALVETLLPGAGERAASLAGTTSLGDFIRMVPGCDLYVTNDTGTMHVAAALGVPTLAIFGPTDEHGTRPLGAAARTVTGEAHCRPCKLRHCPIDHRCMTSISVDAVFEAVCLSLKNNGESSATIAVGGAQ